MDLNLKDRHALVCGASKGIGNAAAMALAAHGATVTLIARDAQALEAARAALPAAHGQQHRCLAADLDQPEALRGLLASALAGAPPVTILVNNTGGPPGGPAAAAATDDYLKTFTRHLIANQVLVQAVLPAMRAAKWGRIVNVISTSVKEPIKGLGVSNTVRGAVAAWAKTLSAELGPDAITVNNVLPGFTKTGRLDEVFEARMKRSGASRAAVEAEAKAEIPLGRFAEPSEVADAILFLCSPAAGYVSGVSLAVDGGRTRSI